MTRNSFFSQAGMAAAIVLGLASADRVQAGTSLCDTTPGNLVLNCGFETGDFTDWAVSGNQQGGVDGNYYGVDDSNPNSGTYEAYLGVQSDYGQNGSGNQYGPVLTLDQTLTVLPSQTYTINFYLANSGCSVADSDCPGYYNYFDVIFDGDTLFSQDNVPTTNGAYQEYSFTGATSAAQTSAVLQFDSTNDNGYFYLDDVSVTAAATPEPASFVLMAAGGLAIGFVRRRRRLASARRLGFSEMRG